jgi:excisionase family DNA binding protein
VPGAVSPVTAAVLHAAVNKESPKTDMSDRLLNHTIAHSAGAAGTAARIDRGAEADAPAASPLVFHTVEEVARTLGVSSKTVRRRIEDGVILKAPMGGRLVRISSAELQRLAAGAPLRPTAASDAVSIPWQILGEE